ncbi:MAG: 2-hydroxy-3-oxopropionate reductase [Planctomycetota bacterium]|jgi:3-hydroxyisobutyrate dehydrogenase
MNPTAAPPASPHGLPRIGWIGTGIMGGAICGRLLDAGFPLTVTSRSRSRAEPLMAKGAAWATTPAEAAAASDVAFACVGYPSDVRQVALGPEGVLAGLRPGTIFVDMTTSEPALAVEIAAAARARGVEALDAPVSGGDVGAREGRLTVMVGGTADAVERLASIWKVIASRVVHCGPPGAGQHTKMANQVAIASTMIGMCESLLYAARAGLDLATTLDAILPGAAGSWSLQNLAPRVLRGDFAPGFMVEHFLKDLGIALGECRRMGLVLPGAALAEQLYRSAAELGHGRSGTQALVIALARLSALDWPSPPAPDACRVRP